MSNDIIEFKDLSHKVDKIPFYLLIFVNIVIVITFFIILMLMVYFNTEYTKDIIVTVDTILTECSNL